VVVTVLRGFAVLGAIALVAGVAGAAQKGWPSPAAGDGPDDAVEVLFTFDDGPNPVTTPQVLDILKAHRIRAVFFMVGEMVKDNKKAAAIVERVLREGHVIANHTMRHKDLCRIKTTDEAAVRDLDDGKAAIEEATHLELTWVRIPFGVRCDRVDKLLAERHLSHFHWDLDPQEWRHGNVEKTVKYVTGELSRAYGRNVLLMHDIKQVTVKALPEILAWIDAENAKRQKSRKRKIRILQAPALVIERLPEGMAAWLADAASGARDLPKTIAALLP
jgi:peptidoglycan/xylan/chitin deacetylase (PgdA/CDA1 family)